jgi:hypothetical protein
MFSAMLRGGSIEEPGRFAIGASCLFLLVAVVVFAARIVYPYDLEFMGGGMLDLAERVRDGRPLFGPPGVESTSFLYGPGWYLVTGTLSKVMSARLAGKLVAVASTFACAALVAFIVRRRHPSGAGRIVFALALVGVAYALTGCWFDLPRVDTLATALLLASVYVATGSHKSAPLASGVLLGAALACRQTLVLVALTMACAHLFTRRWRHAAFFLLGTAIIPAAILLGLSPSSRSWMVFYCFVLPRQHGVDLQRVSLLGADLARAFLLVAATVRCLPSLRRFDDPIASTLAAALLGAFASSVASRLHEGGWPNVLMPWATLAAAAAASTPWPPRFRALTELAIAAQLAVAGPTLVEAIPRQAHRRAAERLTSIVAALEQRGDVWVTGRGQVSRVRHVHSVALGDLLRAGYPLPDDVARACEERAFAAIVIDSLNELLADPKGRFLDVVAGNYYVAGRLDEGPALPTGFAASPRWVLLRRAHRLEGPESSIRLAIHREELRAERHRWELPSDVDAASEGMGVDGE